MKKLLFVTSRIFWPTDSGHKVVLYNYCKGLHEKYGYDIYIYTFLGNGQGEDSLKDTPDFIKQVKIASKVGKITKATNLVKCLFGGQPFQNALFYSKKNKKNVKAYASQIQPDLIMVDMIRLAPYFKAVKEFDCLKVLDLDDLLSLRYKRQAGRKNTKGGLLGTYAKKSSGGILDNNFLKKRVLLSESKRVYKAEIKYGKFYDYVLFVSQKETDFYNQNMVEKANAVTVRLGVDFEYLAEALDVQKEEGALSFLGNLNYAPNVDSLEYVINEVLPKLDFDYKLYVVGGAPDALKQKHASERVIFCGRVGDLRKTIESTEVFLAPIVYGTGIKTKILEAMTMGMPVVTTELGVEGIDAENGKDILIADNTEQFVQMVNELHKDKQKAELLGENARAVMKKSYRWEDIFESFKLLGL